MLPNRTELEAFAKDLSQIEWQKILAKYDWRKIALVLGTTASVGLLLHEVSKNSTAPEATKPATADTSKVVGAPRVPQKDGAVVNDIVLDHGQLKWADLPDAHILLVVPEGSSVTQEISYRTCASWNNITLTSEILKLIQQDNSKIDIDMVPAGQAVMISKTVRQKITQLPGFSANTTCFPAQKK